MFKSLKLRITNYSFGDLNYSEEYVSLYGRTSYADAVSKAVVNQSSREKTTSDQLIGQG